MKTRSAKQKGRRLAQAVAFELLEWAKDLSPDDIKVPPTSVPGEDIWLSPKARERYPFAIEAKNTERIEIWQAMKQAREHAKGTDHKPIVVFSRNREVEPLVCLSLQDLLWLIS